MPSFPHINENFEEKDLTHNKLVSETTEEMLYIEILEYLSLIEIKHPGEVDTTFNFVCEYVDFLFSNQIIEDV